ncbi:MAG: uracil-DNA glycosylase [Desulfobulbaceae bacterium]|nr:uracil-DNA glycosylase [Desulfobulbaceae bacterium]
MAFHRSIGIDSYPGTDSLCSFLTSPDLPQTPGSSITTETFNGPTPQHIAAPKKKEPALTATDNTLEEIRLDLADCNQCSLQNSRTQIVLSTGTKEADLFIIGEWPDSDEDKAGKPFQGANGALLDLMLKAIGLTREQVFLANIVKCRPEGDRAPNEKELKACRPFLIRKIAVVRPKVILTMGPVAAKTMLNNQEPLSRLRGRFHSFKGIDLMPTFHPSFLIANPDLKKATWLDLQMVQKKCAKR